MNMDQYVVEQLHTVADFVRWGVSLFNRAELFYGHGTDSAVDESLTLVLHTIHLPHGLPSELMQARLTTGEKQAVMEMLGRRVRERLPAPYLTHEAWFAGLNFYVDPRVLIPRSPIAELIERGFSPWLNLSDIKRVLDLGTGGGCIAIAIAQSHPHLVVDAADISSDALDVTRLNIERYGLETRVHPRQSDLFSALGGQRYDLIVSNPPYADAHEMASLPEEYRHEPALALAAGPEGLDIVLRLLREAHQHLTAQGMLVVEVGDSEGALIRRLPELPFMWMEFERGGRGVFMLSCEQLRHYHMAITRACAEVGV